MFSIDGDVLLPEDEGTLTVAIVFRGTMASVTTEWCADMHCITPRADLDAEIERMSRQLNSTTAATTTTHTSARREDPLAAGLSSASSLLTEVAPKEAAPGATASASEGWALDLDDEPQLLQAMEDELRQAAAHDQQSRAGN